MSDQIRTAVAAALDHPIFDQGFDLVDTILVVVTDDDVTPESTRHEVAAELTDQIIEDLSRFEAVHLWALLDAADEGAHLYGDTGTPGTMGRIVADLFVVIEPAVFAGLTARADEAGDGIPKCKACGTHLRWDRTFPGAKFQWLDTHSIHCAAFCSAADGAPHQP